MSACHGWGWVCRTRDRNSGRRMMTAREDEPESIQTSSVSLDFATASGPVQSAVSPRPKVRPGVFEPRIGAVLFDQVGGVAHDLRVEDRVALARRKKPGWARPRCAAARCTSPGGLSRRLRCGSCPSPGTQFTRSISSSARSRKVFLSAPKMVNLDEPLVHGAENDRRLAAPAMRIAVMIVLLVQQSLADAQSCSTASLASLLPCFSRMDLPRSRPASAVRSADRLVWANGRRRPLASRSAAVLQAEAVVFQPVPGAMWTKPVPVALSTKLSPAKELAGAVAERMLVFDLAQVPAIEAAHDLVILPAALLASTVEQQHRRDDVDLAPSPDHASE